MNKFVSRVDNIQRRLIIFRNSFVFIDTCKASFNSTADLISIYKMKELSNSREKLVCSWYDEAFRSSTDSCSSFFQCSSELIQQQSSRCLKSGPLSSTDPHARAYVLLISRNLIPCPFLPLTRGIKLLSNHTKPELTRQLMTSTHRELSHIFETIISSETRQLRVFLGKVGKIFRAAVSIIALKIVKSNLIYSTLVPFLKPLLNKG